jgi:hypothetical protein
MSILMKQINEQQAAPSTHNAELTPEIDDAIAWMMNKDPADRPPNLKTAVRALEEAAVTAGLAAATRWELQTGPVVVPTRAINIASAGALGSGGALTGVSDVSVPHQRSSRAGLIAAVLAGVLVAGGAIVMLTRGENADPPPKPVEPTVAPAPAPPPAPTPTPTEKVVTPAAPQTVIITVLGVPAGTEVIAGGMTVGAAPGPVQLPRDEAAMVLTFKADGYVMASQGVVPDADKSIEVKLKKKATGGGRPDRDRIEDPFAPRKKGN